MTSTSYSPSSVTVRRDGATWTMIDATYAPALEYTGYTTEAEAIARRNVRRGVVKAALTRRANKRTAAALDARTAAATAAGVTLAWLAETMTASEVDAWLGIG